MTRRASLILAAGIGRRYGGLKQIDPVGPAGETIIDCSVDDAILRGGETQVKVLLTGSSWFGVTCREDRGCVAEGIRRLVRIGEYPERLWS